LLRVETSGVLAGQILLKHLEVFSGKGILMMIAADQRLRLQLMNQRVSSGKVPISFRFVPHPVEPNAANFSIVRQQLPQLPVHEIEIRIPIPGVRAPRAMSRAPARKIICRVPVQL